MEGLFHQPIYKDPVMNQSGFECFTLPVFMVICWFMVIHNWMQREDCTLKVLEIDGDRELTSD